MAIQGCGLLDGVPPVIMSNMEMNGLSPILRVYVSDTLFFTLDCFSISSGKLSKDTPTSVRIEIFFCNNDLNTNKSSILNNHCDS